MIARSAGCACLLALVLGACSTREGPTVVPAAVTPEPSVQASTRQTPEPSVDPNGLPPTTTTGWWGDPDDPTACARPGSYRIGYRVADIGSCAGMVPLGPKTLTLDVGEDFDLHMTISAEGAPPIWPLPVADDPLVVMGWLMFDNATMTYRALSPGTTRLVTAGACFQGSPSTLPVPAAPGECAILMVTVRDIETSCADFSGEVCRAIGAAAMRANWVLVPGQRVVGWAVRPATFLGGADCGDGVATVTIMVRDPDATFDVSIGDLQASPSGPPRYVVCAY